MQITSPSHDTAQLYRDYGAKVFRWAHRLTRSTSDAADVVQEVFLTVHARRGALEQVRTPGPWLLKITLNVVRHLWRSRGRASKRDLLWMTECLPSAPPDPGDQLELRRAVERLETAVAALPDNYRNIYLLCEIRRLAPADIAASTGLTADALRLRRFRARRQVTKLLSLAPSRPPGARDGAPIRL